MVKEDKVIPYLMCINDHITQAIKFRSEQNSKFRVRSCLLLIKEDIKKAVKILNKELKEESSKDLKTRFQEYIVKD